MHENLGAAGAGKIEGNVLTCLSTSEGFPSWGLIACQKKRKLVKSLGASSGDAHAVAGQERTIDCDANKALSFFCSQCTYRVPFGRRNTNSSAADSLPLPNKWKHRRWSKWCPRGAAHPGGQALAIGAPYIDSFSLLSPRVIVGHSTG